MIIQKNNPDGYVINASASVFKGIGIWLPAVLLLFFCIGCGVKSSPRPPDRPGPAIIVEESCDSRQDRDGEDPEKQDDPEPDTGFDYLLPDMEDDDEDLEI